MWNYRNIANWNKMKMWSLNIKFFFYFYNYERWNSKYTKNWCEIGKLVKANCRITINCNEKLYTEVEIEN